MARAGKLDLFICPVRWKTNTDSEPLLTTFLTESKVCWKWLFL